MFWKCGLNGIAKEIVYVGLTFSVYAITGSCRSYLAFLFHQLDLRDSYINIDDGQKSWIASFINLLSPIGCLSIGIVMDRYGRKISVQSMFVPYLISWFLMAFATNVEMFYVAALIQSIGTGMTICSAAYVSEITTANHRGPLFGTVEICHNIGMLLCNILMYFMKWYHVALLYGALSISLLLLSFILPESPTWLYLKGHKDKAIEILTSIRCQDRHAIEHEIQDLENHCSSSVKGTLKQTIQNCLNAWKPLVMVIVLFILQQNTGYSIMTLYIIMIVDRFRIPYQSTDIALLYAVACTVGGCITPYAFHKFGRKTILAISAFGMAASIGTVSIYLTVVEMQQEKPCVWIVPTALCTYIIAASVGVLPIAFTLAGELFPNEVRGVLNGLYGASSTLYRSFTLKILPWYLALVGPIGIMWTFTAFAVITALYGLFILPETKGKTLNEVQEQYFKKK